ncbi:MBL fold metallo-hydrolase [Haloglomus halophilum]|uniref:MBL fold metallo-hydrolase n=1 Tax=Haloglomus halophilum TaxID=2962672 RepID=UPI0020C95CA1|nr:MBL fold metallo-hydrolase [Haloglomus halophilum]
MTDSTPSPDETDGRTGTQSAPADAPPVHRIETTVDWPPGHAACYLVDADEPVLVDAGAPEDRGAEELREGLDAHGFEPADIAHVLVTHPHTDHDGQVSNLIDAGDPTVYAPAAAVERLERDPDDLHEVVTENARVVGVPEGLREYVVSQAVESLKRNARYCPPEAVDVRLAAGDAFEAGGVTFESIHCPGHQADQFAFAATLGPEADGTDTDGATGDAGERVLFSADAVIEPFRAAALHAGLDDGTFDSVSASYRCYGSLRSYSFDRVYPGHGPVFTDYAGAIERSIESLDDLLDDVESTLAEVGPAPAFEVANTRADIAEEPYVLFETIGACAELVERGRATDRMDDGVRVFSD